MIDRTVLVAGVTLSLMAFSVARAQSHFRYTSNTGNNATVALPSTANPSINGTSLASGDEIGVFTPAGLCVGAVVWSGSSTAITVWGDNDQTPEIDGMRGGEQMLYRVWRQSTNLEYADVSVSYSQGSGSYSPNGIYVISSLSATAPPDAPALSSPADGTTGVSTSPTLNWTASNAATSYRIQVAANGSFSPTAVDQSGITATSYSPSGLSNGTTYYWRVSAANSAGSSSFSSAWTFTTVAAPPATPALVSPTDGAQNQPTTVTLSWSPSSGASTYRLQVARNSSFTSPTLDDSSLTSTAQQVGPLAKNTTYYWRVSAKNSGGWGNWSSVWSFTTIPTAPSEPTPVSPPDTSTNQPVSLTLSWSSVSGATSYGVQLSTSSTFATTVVDDASLSGTSRQVGPLNYNTTYFWRVNAKNAGGTSNWSSIWSFTTVPPPPPAPVLASPTNGATNQPTTLALSWNAAPTAASYQLQASTTSAFTTTTVNEPGITEISKQVGPLSNNTTYYWRVRSAAAGQTSEWSAAWSFATIPLPPSTPVLASPLNGATNQSTTVTLVWNAASGASTYHLQLSANASFSPLILDDPAIAGTSRQISSLSNSATYYWRVFARNDGGVSNESAVWSFTTMPAVPGVPQPLSPANGAVDQPTSLALSWNSSSGADRYHLQVSTGSTFETIILDDTAVSTTSKAIGPLQYSTTYFWRVSAMNSGGGSPWSNAASFTTVSPPPAAPTLYSPADGSINQSISPTLKWSFPTGAQRFRLQVATTSSFSTSILDDPALTDTTKQIGPLENSQTYYWHVNASNGSGTSPYSSTWSFRTVARDTTSAAGPTLSNPSDGAADQPLTLTLSWNSVLAALSYHLQLSKSPSFSTFVVNDASVSETSRQVGPLEHNTMYYWRVRANYLVGTGGWSAIWSFKTVPSMPSAPTLLSPANGTTDQPTSLILSWNSSPGADSYRLQVATTNSFESPVVDDPSVSGTSRQVNSLGNSTTYYWRVSAKNSGGTSGWTSVWSFTTASSAPSSPQAPALSSPADGATNQPTTLTLSWSASQGATTYHLQLATNASFSPAVVDDAAISTTNRQVSGLANSTRYYWRVNASNSGGTSAWSTVWSLTTITSAPSAPILVSPADGATNQPTTLELNWNAVNNATRYRLQVARSASFTSPVLDDTSVTGTSRQVGPLSQNTQYFWRVNASNAGDTSSWSPIWSFTTTNPAPITPATPSLASPTNSSTDQNLTLVLTWSSSFGATVYHLQVATSATFSAPVVDEQSLTQTSRQVGPLAQSTTYYWRVRAGNLAGWSAFSSPWTFTTRTTYPATISVDTSFVFATHSSPTEFQPTDYRLIGFPGASNQSIASYVSGEVGKEWQVYWDNGNPEEYLVRFDGSSNFATTVGKAFWLIKNGSWNMKAVVPTAPLNATQEIEIPLHEGWNLITNPFTSRMDWVTVKNLNSVNEPIYAFNGSFYATSSFGPYNGYYFFNATHLTVLRVPLNSNSSGTTVQSQSLLKKSDLGEWNVTITLRSSGIVDSTAWLGVAAGASDGLDALDFRKPRGVGSLPTVYFSRPDWDAKYSSFASDIRAGGKELSIWNVEVQAEPWKNASLSFQNVESIPPALRVVLVDEARGRTIDLRQEGNYSFLVGSPISHFSVLVGEPALVDQQISSVHPPTEFELGNNYPNPFNPSTTIPLLISTKGELSLKIYNALGQEVRTLFVGTLDEGKYTFTWDGKDNQGRSVTSGVYLLHVKTSSGVQKTKKMLMTK